MAKKIKISKEEIEEIQSNENTSKKNASKIGLIISIICNVVLVIVLINCYSNITDLSEENNNLNQKVSNLESDSYLYNDLIGDKSYWYIKSKLDFFDAYIVFQPEKNKKYFH